MRQFFSNYVALYHPEYVTGFQRCNDGYWMACYGMGPLRASLFGVRVPVIWAFELLIKTGKVPR